MPTVKSFSNCKVVIYAMDHVPPHVHVLTGDGREVLVVIENGDQIGSGVRAKEIRSALEWIANNRRSLLAKFKELNP